MSEAGLDQDFPEFSELKLESVFNGHEKEVGLNEQGIDSQAVNKIVKARITELPRRLGDPLPEVWVTLSGGTEKMLFTFYPDEISFSEADFIGLTKEEARLLKFGRDRAYLQS